MTPTASASVAAPPGVVAVLPGGGLPVAAVPGDGRHRCCRPSRRRGRAGLAGPAAAAPSRHTTLPGLPPLPVLDLSALLKPLTDLLGAFGTADLAAAADLREGLQRLVVAIGFDRLGDDLGTACRRQGLDWHRGDQRGDQMGRTATESGMVAAQGWRDVHRHRRGRRDRCRRTVCPGAVIAKTVGLVGAALPFI